MLCERREPDEIRRALRLAGFVLLILFAGTNWSEAQRLTVVVAIFSIILSLTVWGVDTVFSKLVSEYFVWIKS